MEGLAKNLRLNWTGDLDSLKIFVKEILKLDGEWTQPVVTRSILNMVIRPLVGERINTCCPLMAKNQVKLKWKYVR